MQGIERRGVDPGKKSARPWHLPLSHRASCLRRHPRWCQTFAQRRTKSHFGCSKRRWRMSRRPAPPRPLCRFPPAYHPRPRPPPGRRYRPQFAVPFFFVVTAAEIERHPEHRKQHQYTERRHDGNGAAFPFSPQKAPWQRCNRLDALSRFAGFFLVVGGPAGLAGAAAREKSIWRRHR